MLVLSLKRLLFRHFVMQAVEGEGGAPGGGPATETPAAAGDSSATVGTPAAEPATPIEAPAPAEAAPKNMLEAVNRALGPDRGDGRDDTGRFVGKPGEEKPAAVPAPVAAQMPAAAPVQAAKPATEPPKAAAPADDLAMPEGLSPGAQQRFQKLATTNRELSQRVEQSERQVNYVRETFQSHGIRQDQFEQAVAVLGMMNRGDLAGAQRVLQQQLRQISIMTGQPSVPVDALADFPDLRQAADGMQITEQHALELARARQQQALQQQYAQDQQRHQQTLQAQQQQTQRGLQDVDAFCSRMKASDVDYPAIEAQLLPKIQELCAGLPPQTWAQVIQTNYQLMKQAAAAARSSVAAAPAINPLRPTGSSAPQQAPRTMYDAMFPRA